MVDFFDGLLWKFFEREYFLLLGFPLIIFSGSRRTDHNCKLIEGCQVLENDFEDELCWSILEMKKIDGRHIPSTSPIVSLSHVTILSFVAVGHLVSLLEWLPRLPKENLVMGDFRLSNVIFTPDGKAVVIDFDYSGPPGEQTYPEGFNRDIPDGARHPVEILDYFHQHCFLIHFVRSSHAIISRAT